MLGLSTIPYSVQTILLLANRIGFQLAGYSVAQLKILQAVITLSVFVPLAVFDLREPLKLDYSWAALCLLGRCTSSSAVHEG